MVPLSTRMLTPRSSLSDRASVSAPSRYSVRPGRAATADGVGDGTVAVDVPVADGTGPAVDDAVVALLAAGERLGSTR